MLATCVFLGTLLIVVGLFTYKFPNLINPYSGMTPDRKALVDINGLKRALLWIMMVSGIAFFGMALFDKYLIVHPQIYGVGMTAICVAMLVAVFVAMKRHNGWGRDENGTTYFNDRERSAWIIGAVVIAMGVFALTFVALVQANKPSVIAVEDGMLHISGSYGREIPVEQIVSMEVLDEMPGMAMRTNGSSFNNQNKGHFLTKDNEKCLLFVTYNGGPYIKLRTSDNLIYLNRGTSEETIDLIVELKGAMK